MERPSIRSSLYKLSMISSKIARTEKALEYQHKIAAYRVLRPPWTVRKWSITSMRTNWLQLRALHGEFEPDGKMTSSVPALTVKTCVGELCGKQKVLGSDSMYWQINSVLICGSVEKRPYPKDRANRKLSVPAQLLVLHSVFDKPRADDWSRCSAEVVSCSTAERSNQVYHGCFTNEVNKTAHSMIILDMMALKRRQDLVSVDIGRGKSAVICQLSSLQLLRHL